MSVPLTRSPPAPPTTLFAKRFADSFFYMLYFQEPGVAEAELDADIRRSLRLLYVNASGDVSPARGFLGKPKGSKLLDGMIDPQALPAWLTEHDLDIFTAELERSGFRGPLNRYRNMDRDWEELADLRDAKVTVPALFLTGDKDIATHLAGADAIDQMRARVPDLREVRIIPGAGHWVQQEKPEEVNAALLTFLEGLGGAGAK
jgi:pimeloyl-ACP methyl ester carboxylesterase